MVQGLGSGFRVQGFGFRIWGSGFGICFFGGEGLGLGVEGCGGRPLLRDRRGRRGRGDQDHGLVGRARRSRGCGHHRGFLLRGIVLKRANGIFFTLSRERKSERDTGLSGSPGARVVVVTTAGSWCMV